jgi:hypothetical protein
MRKKNSRRVGEKESRCTNDISFRSEERKLLCVIPGFRRGVEAIYALLGYYAVLSGSYVATFRDNLWGPIFKSKAFFLNFLTLEDGTDSFFPETSVQNYHSTLRNIPKERRY